MTRAVWGWDMAAKHEHPEAFMLMWYATNDGSERERLWNSRDGVTPFGINSATTGAEMLHTFKGDVYAPNHVPRVGDRIFVDLTPQRAQIFAARRVEAMLQDEEYRRSLESNYASREEAIAAIANDLLRDGKGGVPDILVVTAGYIEELLEVRKRGAEPEMSIGVQREPAPQVRVIDEQSQLTEAQFQAIQSARSDWTPLGVALEVPSVLFDKQGRPLTVDEWNKLLADDSYRLVAETRVRDGRITTIWMGMSFPFDGDTVRVFESAFRPDLGIPRKLDRYATEAEARAGHTRHVDECGGAFTPPEWAEVKKSELPQQLRGRHMFYGRDGKPISAEEYMQHAGREAYKRLAWTKVRAGLEVSTVWIGYDGGNPFYTGAPRIFETMVVHRGKPTQVLGRYATEDEAHEGHERACARVTEQDPHYLCEAHHRAYCDECAAPPSKRKGN